MIAAYVGLAPDLAEVERHMALALTSREPTVAALIDDLGTFHGKLLRPALLLLTARTLGKVQTSHHQLGAALELIHTATLIHDDLIDDADTRRSKPTAHVRFGNTTAVLLGDYFYTHAFALVASQRNPDAMLRLVTTTNVICRGELHQQCVARATDTGEAEYLDVIYGKTACLTELAAELGALGGTPTEIAAAAAYGRACGMAFQIADDCLDFADNAEKVGKTLGTDLERGRMTLPVIRLLAQAGSRRVQLARGLAGDASASELAGLRQEIIAGGALESARDTARAYVRDAVAALQGLPAGGPRDQLAELARFIVDREF